MMVLCEPKHIGAAFIILNILIILGFYNFCALVDNKVSEHVQMFFPIMNTWCMKHVEDTKNWIRTLFEKYAFVGLRYIVT